MNRHQNIAVKTVIFSILSNMCLACIKYSAGHYGHSYALIADSIESASDSVSSMLLLGAMLYASKKSNKHYPYGYGKAESLMTFISIGLVFICGVTIVWQSLHNLEQSRSAPEAFTLYILGAIIGWKELSFQYVSYHANTIQSLSLKADAWHHRSDALSSVAAFIGVSIAVLMGPGYEHADDWAALVAAMIILYNAYSLIHPAFNEIIDGNVYQDVEQSLRTIASSVPQVLHIEQCYLRKAGMFYHGELHIQVDPNLSVFQGHTIAHNVERAILHQMLAIQTLMIHVEPFNQPYAEK